jgi:hypothetical protein
MADVPHERSLVKRLEGKPFALLGINSDKDREVVKKAVAKEGITWRSWWNGGGTDGPITRKWNVHSWPALYLLDATGVIRYKGDYLRGRTYRDGPDGKLREVHLLDEAVDTLLKEMDRDSD